MTVHELITKLEALPRFSEVVFDFTPSGCDHFVFSPVAAVEELDLAEEGAEPEWVVAISRNDFSDEHEYKTSSPN